MPILTITFLPVETESYPDPDFDGHVLNVFRTDPQVDVFIINNEGGTKDNLEFSEWERETSVLLMSKIVMIRTCM